MSGSRAFDGARGDDIHLRWSAGITAAATYLLVLRPAESGDDTWLSTGPGNFYDPEFGYDGGSDRVYFRSDGGVATTLLLPLWNTWQVLAVTRSAGGFARFHRVDLSGVESPLHVPMRGSVGDIAPSDPLIVGGDGEQGDWQLEGEIAAVALWASALSDADVESCTSWEGIETLSPDQLIRLDGDPPFYGQLDIHGTTHSDAEPPGFWPGPTAVVREIADRLTLTVAHADGHTTRWAGDEADAALVAAGLEFGDSAPGGFKDCQCELLRDLTPRADEGLFDDVRVAGAGGRTAWEGRMARLPRNAVTLRPGAVGWQAHLDDDASFQEVYVDRDLTRWEPASVQRRINRHGGGYSVVDGAVAPDTSSGKPALATEVVGTWMPTSRPEAEMFFDARVPLAELYYAWRRGTNINAAGDDNWEWVACLAESDTLGGLAVTSNLRAEGPSSGTLRATSAAQRWAAVLLRHNYSGGAGGTQGLQYSLWWTCLALYGRHGLAKQGAGSFTDPPGLLVTDILADVVRRGAPLLDVDVAADPFALTHFPNIGPAKPSEWVQRLNAYLLWPWGVWDDRTFRAAPVDPDTGTVWVARASEGARPDFDGDAAEDVFNGVVVTFTDPIGRERTVGPPGATAHETSALLHDDDPSNPVNAHGIPRRWALLRLSLVTTTTQAIQLGAAFLAESQLARRSGSITVTGSIERRGEPGRYPAWAPRAGDFVTIGDRPGEPLRFITEKRYDHRTRTSTLRFGWALQKLDAILERMGAALVGVVS